MYENHAKVFIVLIKTNKFYVIIEPKTYSAVQKFTTISRFCKSLGLPQV